MKAISVVWTDDNAAEPFVLNPTPPVHPANDQMRDHKRDVGDVAAELLSKWQRGHQLSFYYGPNESVVLKVTSVWSSVVVGSWVPRFRFQFFFFRFFFFASQVVIMCDTQYALYIRIWFCHNYTSHFTLYNMRQHISLNPDSFCRLPCRFARSWPPTQEPNAFDRRAQLSPDGAWHVPLATSEFDWLCTAPPSDDER